MNKKLKQKLIQNLVKYINEKESEIYTMCLYNCNNYKQEPFGELEHKLKIKGYLRNARKYAKKLEISIEEYIDRINSVLENNSKSSHYEKLKNSTVPYDILSELEEKLGFYN